MFPRFVLALFTITLSLPIFADRPKFPDLAIPDTLGVNIHFTSPKPGEMEMLAAGGFKWVRMDFAWGGTERKKGEYDFSAYDKLIASLEPHGIRALFILDYSNKLYDEGRSPHTEEGRQAMAAWAAAAVQHFKGKPIVWEMWNEPNIAQFWKPKPNAADYAQLAIAVGKAIRKAAPEEIYFGPATSTIDLHFLEECFKAGCLEYWDAVSVHPYRQKDPETATEEYRKLRLLIAKYAPKGKTIPILSGEWGFSAAWGKFDEERQGKYLPREFLTNLYNEVPVSIWYDWHNDGKDPKEPEHHFGTVNNAYLKDKTPVYEPKPAYLAAQTLSKQLAGFKYNKRIVIGDDQNWVLLFAKDKDVRIAAWTTSKTAREVTIPASPGKFTVTNHLGDKTSTISADGKGLKVTLSDSVQYLVPEQPNDLLRIGAAWERVPLERIVKAPGQVELGVGVPKNPLDRPVRMGPVKEFLLRVPPAGEPFVTAGTSHQMLLNRGTTIVPIRDTLFIENLGEFQQALTVIVENPINASILAPRAGCLPIQIDNPSGEPFAGVIELADAEKITTAEKRLPLKLAQGQMSKVLSFNITQAEPIFRAGLKIADDSMRDAEGNRKPEGSFTIPAARFAPCEFIASDLGARLKLHTDGDPKVKSEQSISIADPPQPSPAGPQPCMKLTYAFEAGWKFIRVAPATEQLRELPLAPKRFGMWVYADGNDNRLRLRYNDSTGQCFQPDGVRLNWKGWRWVTLPMDGTDQGHWGGANDGQIHPPIRWDSILLLDGSKREKIAGEIYVTGMMLME